MRLQQVFINLITNAIKYSPERGIIEIETKIKYLDELGSCIVSLSVSDCGIGISEENLSKLFQPFFRVKNEEN